LVLTHGYPDTLQIWSAVISQLTRSFDVIAFDWPGLGYSEQWPGGASPFHMAERLAALLDDWHVQSPILAGIDMGAQPILAFAARYPHRARSLIVINSLVQWDAETSMDIALLRHFGWNRFALRYFPRVVFHRAIRTFLPAGESLDDSIRADMWSSFRKRDVRDFIVRMCAAYQGTLPLLAKEYPSIHTPTLLLWAEHDRHFPPEQARALQSALPDCRLRIIAGAQHWMPLSMPHAVTAQILDFAR
jgi:pimeloyl-ACP methyl ester carboxylesterase